MNMKKYIELTGPLSDGEMSGTLMRVRIMLDKGSYAMQHGLRQIQNNLLFRTMDWIDSYFK